MRGEPGGVDQDAERPAGDPEHPEVYKQVRRLLDQLRAKK